MTLQTIVVLSLFIFIVTSQTLSPFPINDGSEVIIFDRYQNPLPQCSFNARAMEYELEGCNTLSLEVKRLLAKEWYSVGKLSFYGRRLSALNSNEFYTAQCNAVYINGIVIVPHHCLRDWIPDDLRMFWSSLHRSSFDEFWERFQHNDMRDYHELEQIPLFQQKKGERT